MPVRYLCKIGKCATGGESGNGYRATYLLIRHCLRSQPSNDDNETGVADRVSHFDSNLPYPLHRGVAPSLLTKILLKDKRNRSARPVWHIIISGEDKEGSVETLTQLRDAFLARYTQDAPWLSVVHSDHDHLHMHMVIANYCPASGHALDLLRQDRFREIRTLAFAQGMPNVLNSQGLVPFEWREAANGEGRSRAKGAYSKARNQNAEELAQRIATAPGELAQHLQQVGELDCEYQNERPVFTYKGTKISLRDINYFLLKAKSRLYLTETLQSSADIPIFMHKTERGALEREAQSLASKLQTNPDIAANPAIIRELDYLKKLEDRQNIRMATDTAKVLGNAVGEFAADMDF